MDHGAYKSLLAGTPQPKRKVSKAPKPIRPIGGSASVPRPQPSSSAIPTPSQPRAADPCSDVPPERVPLADLPEWVASVYDIGARALRRGLALCVGHGSVRFHHRIGSLKPGVFSLGAWSACF